MIKKLFLAAAMLFTTVGVFAQEPDTTVIFNNYQYNITDNDESIQIKIYEMKDGKKLSNEALYESNYRKKRNSDGNTSRFSFSKNKDQEFVWEETGTAVFSSTSRWFNNELKQPLPSLYFSHLQMTEGPFGPMAPNMHQRPSSFEWGLYFPTTIFCTKGGHFGMATGLGISNSYNYFSHDWVLAMVDGNSTFVPLSEYSLEEGPVNNYAHRSFLRYWSLRLPLTMQLQFKVNKWDYLSFSAGAELEWRFGMRSFARYGGAKHTISNDLDYNAIGVNALFQVGFNDIIVFGRMGLTEFFNSKNLNDMYQMSIGIGFNFD